MTTTFGSVTTQNQFSTHLKRSHTEANHTFAANSNEAQPSGPENGSPRLPSLPKIPGELILQVYTHKSLRRSEDVSPEEFEDSERLSVLGDKVFSAAITFIMFKRRPMKRSEELQKITQEIASDSNIDTWVTFYKLREKVRCTPAMFPKLLGPEETRLLFYAFVGGLYLGSGLDVVCDWLDRLLGGEGNPVVHTQPTVTDRAGPPPTYRPSTPPQKRIRSETPQSSFSSASSPNGGIFFASQPPPSPSPAQTRASPFMTAYQNTYGGATASAAAKPYPTTMTPPQVQTHQQNTGAGGYAQYMSTALPQQRNTFNPLSPAQPHLAFLPLFNQTAAQRKVKVDYNAQFSGPSHAGKWTVQCVVNGILKGMGSGVTKQVAKEEAARQAYYAMGWT